MSESSESPKNCTHAPASQSGAAALAIISEADGVPVTVRELLDLTALAELREIDEAATLVLGRAAGYDVVSMEGGYDDLPDVRLPLVVTLRQDGRERYAVLHTFDETSARVADPATGEVKPWTREDFCAQWTGSVIQATPIDAERTAFAARLRDARDPKKRVLRALGWAPPYWRRGAMLAGWAVTLGLALSAPRESPLDGKFAWLVAAACAGSAWSWLASDACAGCSRGRQRAGGLPLATVGTALYVALLIARFFAVPRAATGLAMGAALGAHAALAMDLLRSRVACPICFFVAACAAGATGLSLARGDATVLSVGSALVIGALLVTAILPRARARAARIARVAAEELAHAVAIEPSEQGRVRVVVFKRAGCASCAFFEAAIKPALLALFEDAISISERDIGNAPTTAPLVIILGKSRYVFVGLPVDDAIEQITEAVRDAASDGSRRDQLIVHHAA